MRELEFLPQWYSRLERRRGVLWLQAWLTLALFAGLGLWVFLAERNVRSTAYALRLLDGQLKQTDNQVRQMDLMQATQRQCRQKADVLAKLGTHVDSARILGRLGELMPANVSLVQLSFELDETPAALPGAARAALKDRNSAPLDRRLRARVQGVAPTDVELATLLTELNKVPFLDNVTATYSRDKRQLGHVLREFELVFTINLNAVLGS